MTRICQRACRAVAALVVAGGIAAAASTGRPAGPDPPPLDAPRIAAVVRALGGGAADAEAVTRVYETRGFALAWTSVDGILTPVAAAVRARLEAAADHGLDPEAYRSSAHREALDTRDVALTLATLRYMRHLHRGRVEPRAAGFALDRRPAAPDYPRLLADALSTGDVVATLAGLAPDGAAYRGLVRALAHYRALAGAALPTVPPAVPAVRAGDPYAGVAAVARRLEALGDLAPSARPLDGEAFYREPVVSAVRRFQARHGLTPDGVLGGRTVAALQVPVARRVRQIELALERLRWLHGVGPGRVVLVNIPMFRLWAWDAGAFEGPAALSMAVIVGRARRTQTPVFDAVMEQVVFRPYWNVPASILRHEILPAMRRAPGYLDTQQMELVRGAGDDAAVVPENDDTRAALAAGTVRVRQRPGPHNALGLVKFVFPNRDSVYMHGTPAPALFARDRRDLSHGCVRLAEPPALAAWVLADVPGWGPAEIAAAMAAPSPQQVPVGAPIAVVLFYVTAMIDPGDGTLHVADDLYGLDARLATALARR